MEDDDEEPHDGRRDGRHLHVRVDARQALHGRTLQRHDDGAALGDDARGAVVQNPATGLEFVRHYSEDAVFEGVVITSIECGGDLAVVYDEQGRATEPARITLEFGGDRRVVVLEAGSGEVTLLGSSSGWVDRGY